MPEEGSKLQILMLTHRFPFPPDKGDRIRSYYWLKALSARHEVDVLTFSVGPVPEEHLRELKRLVRNVYVVQHNSWTLGLRLAGGMLTGRSLTESYFRSRDSGRVLETLLDYSSYDLCLAVCSSMGWQVSRLPRDMRLIVDLVDVDSAKWRMYGRKHSGLERWVFNRESRTIAKLERRLAERAAMTVTVSRRECELLLEHAPGVSTLAIPNGVDIEYFTPGDIPRPADRLAFVGQMDYFPNVDAVLWFAEHVWPEISVKYPHVRWNIVGRSPTRQVRQLERLRNVSVTGAVPDVRPYLTSAIAVAPLQIACGVQNKVLEAMSAGRPVIATPGVASGLDVRPQEDLLIADSAKEWILAINLLLSDPQLAQNLGTAARRTMVERFTWAGISEQMLSCVSAVASSRACSYTDQETFTY